MAPHLAPAAVLRPRRDSIDLVRGLVMVIMALDHVRDFFGASPINPRDVTDAALFLTRWITHFCAPTFIFLAGVSAYLFGHRGRTPRHDQPLPPHARALARRPRAHGRPLRRWTFSIVPEILNLQVIWAIGWSMVALSAWCSCRAGRSAPSASALIVGHNLLDGVHAARSRRRSRWLWDFVHDRAVVGPFLGIHVIVSYPLIPWIGVMAAGYAFGPIFTRPAAERTRSLAFSASAPSRCSSSSALIDVYGDPTRAWRTPTPSPRSCRS